MSSAIHIEKNFGIKKFFWAIGLVQFFYLLLMLYSPYLSFGFSFLLIFPVLFYFYPEIGLIAGFSGNIILYLLFDSIPHHLPAPVVIAQIVLLFSSVMFLYFVQNRHTPINSLLLKLVLLIGLIMIFGLLYSSNKAYAIQKIVFYFIFNFLIFFALQFLINDFRRIDRLILFVFISGVILGLYGILSDKGILFKYLRYSPSVSINPIFYARTLGLTLLIGFYLYIKSNNPVTRIFIIISIGVCFLPMIWTGSRAPLLGVIISILGFYMLKPSRTVMQKVSMVFLGVLLSSFFLIQFASQVVVRLQTPILQETSAAFRILAWFQAFQDFFSSPVLGIGTGSFAMETPWTIFTYPHNLILELLCENGIIGLLLIGSFVYFSFKYGISNIRHLYNTPYKNLAIIAVCIFIYSFWNSMFSGDIFKNDMVWAASGLIAVIYTSMTNKSEQDEY